MLEYVHSFSDTRYTCIIDFSYKNKGGVVKIIADTSKAYIALQLEAQSNWHQLHRMLLLNG
jgi:hypothetical protein